MIRSSLWAMPLAQALLVAAYETAMAIRPRPDWDPKAGSLVIEVTGWPGSRRGTPIDWSSIGHLVAHGEAPLHVDGSGPTREVWDIRPIGGGRSVRWENADFIELPTWFDALVQTMLSAGLLPGPT